LAGVLFFVNRRHRAAFLLESYLMKYKKPITAKNFPAAFAAMDAAAAEFWAYPDAQWQEAFLLHWAQENDARLAAASVDDDSL